MTNYEYVMQMNEEEFATWLTNITNDAQIDSEIHFDYQWKDWSKEQHE